MGSCREYWAHWNVSIAQSKYLRNKFWKQTTTKFVCVFWSQNFCHQIIRPVFPLTVGPTPENNDMLESIQVHRKQICWLDVVRHPTGCSLEVNCWCHHLIWGCWVFVVRRTSGRSFWLGFVLGKTKEPYAENRKVLSLPYLWVKAHSALRSSFSWKANVKLWL